MKTMGLTELVLVNPRTFPDEEATRLAAGATDVLENARCIKTLEEAVNDCVQVVGASARLRSMPLPHFDEPDEMAQQVIDNAHQAPVALVFGRERSGVRNNPVRGRTRSGLTNDEIRCCSHQVSIPANPEYGILNLSQAVQILAYEVHRAWRKRNASGYEYQRPLEATPPSRQQFGYFQEHLGRLMQQSGFLTQPHARTEEQLQALFARAQPSRKELSLLRGLLSAFEAHLPKQ